MVLRSLKMKHYNLSNFIIFILDKVIKLCHEFRTFGIVIFIQKENNQQTEYFSEN